MIKLKNKKATEGDIYLSIWMFLIWAIIGVSIVAGVILFDSVQADARGAESVALANKLADCLNDKFSPTLFNSNDFDIYATCNLNKKALEDTNLYFFSILIKESSSNDIFSIQKGNALFETQCKYQQDNNKIEKNFAQCASKTLTLNKDGKNFEINILTASNQDEKV